MVEKPDEKGGPPDSPLAHLAQHSGHGLTIALSTGLFLLAGWWVDGKLGTRPLFTIAGALLGAAAGFYSLLQHMLFLPRQREQEKLEERRRAAEEEKQDGGGSRGGSEGRSG
jgi:hypothetical protein